MEESAEETGQGAASQPASQPANQPVSQPVSQPVHRPAGSGSRVARHSAVGWPLSRKFTSNDSIPECFVNINCERKN